MNCMSGVIGKLFYYYPDKLVNKLGHIYYQSQIKGKLIRYTSKEECESNGLIGLLLETIVASMMDALCSVRGGNAGKQRYNLNRSNSIGTSIQNE